MGGDSRYSIYTGWVSKLSRAPSGVEEAGEGDLISYSYVIKHRLGEREGAGKTSDAFMFRPHSCLWPELQASLCTVWLKLALRMLAKHRCLFMAGGGGF